MGRCRPKMARAAPPHVIAVRHRSYTASSRGTIWIGSASFYQSTIRRTTSSRNSPNGRKRDVFGLETKKESGLCSEPGLTP